ncbi:MAG TPA: ADP-ribosylglycohydrolase family protein [Limnochordia bacterium]|nr:ADP-ribosylglycohydrolase family protein [Limnochordia bacterium]
MGYEERARNALYGLAMGDAISWPSLYHRSYTLPFWTRRLRREIDVAQEGQNILRFPMPFSLNRPTEALQYAPTDDTEWACFTAKLLIESKGQLSSEQVYTCWQELANLEEPVRGSISVHGALHNLGKGLLPPVTGADNAHYFDDSACMRAIPIGVVYQDNKERLLEAVTLDATVTNSRDGLWAAQAVAVAIGKLCSGSSLPSSLQEAQEVLPPDSWVARSVKQALDLVQERRSDSIFALIPELDRMVNKEYSYGGAAPEVLALAFALTLLVDGDFELGVLHALAFPKVADSLPALVGALCGATSDSVSLASDYWVNAIHELQGICLPTMAEVDYLRIVEDLVYVGSQVNKIDGSGEVYYANNLD